MIIVPAIFLDNNSIYFIQNIVGIYKKLCIFAYSKTNYGHEGIDSSIRATKGCEGLHEVSIGETRRHSVSDDHECHEREERAHGYHHSLVRCIVFEDLSDNQRGLTPMCNALKTTV